VEWAPVRGWLPLPGPQPGLGVPSHLVQPSGVPEEVIEGSAELDPAAVRLGEQAGSPAGPDAVPEPHRIQARTRRSRGVNARPSTARSTRMKIRASEIMWSGRSKRNER